MMDDPLAQLEPTVALPVLIIVLPVQMDTQQFRREVCTAHSVQVFSCFHFLN